MKMSLTKLQNLPGVIVENSKQTIIRTVFGTILQA